MTKHIAVVGGGPKAAAICAKADILNRVQRADLRVTVFEMAAIGANWTGASGYTDGLARLCTPAERDLGFPYDAGVMDPQVAAAMYGEFSWGAYQLSRGRSDAQSGYNNWVNRGRLAPTHRDFAAYISWAIEKSNASVEISTVERLVAGSGGWTLHRRMAGGARRRTGSFDGVVFTGPGGPVNAVQRHGGSARITNGRDFWRDADGFLASAGDSDDPILILGAGGTAAAIAARAVRAKQNREILVIGDQAALFARAETFFESQIYTDESIWQRLDTKTRREVTDRLNRGVVWATISDELARSSRVRFEPGRASSVTVDTGDVGEEISVVYGRGGAEYKVYASLVIDASGFDPWWFVPLLPKDLGKRLTTADRSEHKEIRGALADGMTRYLELFDEAPGPIHAPMVSQAVGPGFLSLMALGAMSDRILNRYL
jgi:mycobactin lysine-N-oxygenase